MMRSRTPYFGTGLCGLVLAVLAAGCASPDGAGSRQAAPAPAAPKRITTAMMGNPPGAFDRFIGGGSGGNIPGISGLEQLVTVGFSIANDKGARVPMLAEAVPSVENGLWKVLPDGRMETTWRIRQGAQWHDGTPFTSEDVLFTARVEQDRELPIPRNSAYEVIESIEAPDAQSVRVTWKKTYIEADQLWGNARLPKHIFEQVYPERKDAIVTMPYWTSEFVGTGPYKIRQWVRDSHAVLEANDAYALGRPKIDEIVVKFLADENAFMANILAGEVDVTLGKSITLEQTLSVRDQWREGHVEISGDTAMKVWPQFLNPNPAIVANVQFRKAMQHSMDRQQMVDTIMGGLSSIAHSQLLPTDREIAEVDSAIVKYEYDPRKAAQMIEGLGYTKGPDGFFRDGSGQRLQVEISATAEDQNTKPMFAVADGWQRMGVGVDAVVIPTQRQSDREYRANFPAFTLQGGGGGVASVDRFVSSQARLPERNYAGSNYSRYMNPEFDALVERFLSTIPWNERMQALRAVMHHMTDQLNVLSIYYAASTSMIGNRMVNVGPNPTWNAHEWDVKS